MFGAVRIVGASVAVALVSTLVGMVGAGDQTALQAALDRALQDERHARAFYAAVMAKHGERPPFSRIINAEARHVTALLAQYERLELKPPDDVWAAAKLDVPTTFAEACDASIVAEIRNVRMYDELIAGVDDEDVRFIFERLRTASREQHLPAFRRHGSGWERVEAEKLDGTPAAQRDRAFAARNEMFGTLVGELTAAMTSGGPAAAIDVCSKRAPAIAASIGAKHDLRIGRTSWKLRNPDNRGPIWTGLLVDERPETPRFMVDRAGRLAVMTPIQIATPCLKCHGAPDALAPDVTAALVRLYPEDRATGFAEGDLRGWFWIEVPGDGRPASAPGPARENGRGRGDGRPAEREASDPGVG